MRRLLDCLPTRIDRVSFQNQFFYIKRDDLITPLSGNKLRKFYYLTQLPSCSFQNKVILSYGGVQSNAMFALATLAPLLHPNLSFHYYTRPIPAHLKENPVGNWAAALDAGMIHHQVSMQEYSHIVDTQQPLDTFPTSNCIWIPQGGDQPEAELGIHLLAKELNDFYQAESLKDLTVLLPAGTGTTTRYLQKHLTSKISLFPISCVHRDNLSFFPNCLESVSKFAALHPSYMELYTAFFNETGIELDLIYGIPTLFRYLQTAPGGRPVLILHTGGLEGNSSQMLRYQYWQAKVKP